MPPDMSPSPAWRPAYNSPGNSSVRGLLSRRVSESAGASAYFEASSGRSVDWSHIAAGAATLEGTFARPGAASVTGLALGDTLGFAATYVSALAAGMCIAPLDPRSTAEEMLSSVAALRVADLIVDSSAPDVPVERLQDAGVRIWTLRGTELRPAGPVPKDTPPPPSHQEGPGVLLATSGTTGEPKVVPLKESQLLHVAGAIADHHELSRSDVGFCPLPLFHINAQVVGLLSTLVSGGRLALEARFRPREFWDGVAESQATWLNLVPAILGILCDLPTSRDHAGAIRFARSASAPLPEAILHRFEANTGIGVLETYGMTEAASQIAANPLLRSQRRPGSAGMPVRTGVRVVGEAGGELMRAGLPGRIQISGPSVVERYLGAGPDGLPRAALTKDGWLDTGDVGFLDPDGFLYVSGRADDVINRGGEKVYPREVEEVLIQHPEVALAAVAAEAHPLLGAQPVAFVTTSAQHDASESQAFISELEAMCARSLSRYKRPVRIVLVQALPTGRTGKLDRKRLAGEVPLRTQPLQES